MSCFWAFKDQNNKKVLLRECKRHTACRVVSTHSVVLSWLNPTLPPPPADAPPTADPPAGWPPPKLTPPCWLTPPQLADPPPPCWMTPPGWVSWLTPPPVDRQIDGWMDGQTRVKTLPSRRTTYAGGNYCLLGAIQHLLKERVNLRTSICTWLGGISQSIQYFLGASIHHWSIKPRSDLVELLSRS